ncbi:hypothetical protein [Actinomadura rugatobispora]|uniref:LPXTG cell wall anchor domain-containing protein n=1 Tax=Actinomadura rugatobispora TaxID=1994 RepID=A0ABW1A135_9ACTN|nr:hypothetical protein GCM10010200_045390 [Actinomadura rugatobispora]
MRAIRLAATGFAAGAMVLGMAAPALAAEPVPTTVTPGAFCKNEHLGQKSKTKDGTPMICLKKPGEKQGRWRAVAPDVPTPPKPVFKFGYDKVKLSSRRVVPGGTTTFTVTCPSTVTITGNGYTRSPLAVKKLSANRWTATGTFRTNLPDPTTATVVCKGYGSVKLSTSPEKNDGLKPKQPKIPTGRIDTGDGSTQGNGSALPAAGLGALALAGLGAFALRRRTARERS